MIPLNSLGLTHYFVSQYVREGDTWIDATAGKGRDTAFLAQLVGESGHVIAFDIQPDAIRITDELLKEKSLSNRVELHLGSHTEMDRYADPLTVDGIVFNLGWLPGGDHNICTRPETTKEAILRALSF